MHTHLLLPEPTYLPLGTTAHKQGRIASDNALGGQVVKVFDLAVARTGLRDAEAAAAGYDPVTIGSEEFDHKAYYQGAHRLRLRITGDRTPGSCSARKWSVITATRWPCASTSPPPPCSTT
jgi:NADPH-dependent 2,4-dienoyl-CoA reductase/sulfur reductase-like enzyme